MPTRSKRFLAGLVTGYGNIMVNVVFTMVSVPLALHYLDKEQFGLWALAVQISGYLGLIDLGMSSAISRFAADHKDNVNGGEYGSNLITGAAVFLIQGMLVAACGIGFSWLAPSVFAVPAHLSEQFRILLVILSATTGAGVALRSIGSPLWAFQRSDLINGCSSASLIINLALLWLGFANGLGLITCAIAPIPALLATSALCGWVCRRNGYYPSKGNWGKPSLTVFKGVFSFGKDTVIISIGGQLINASQIMIISRFISLEAAATFAVATKFYTLAMSLVTTPVAASAPGLTELHVRGDKDRFNARYWDLIIMVLALATIGGSCLAMGNRTFISLWTHGRVTWDWSSDYLLGLLIVFRNLSGCMIGMFGLLKDWRPVRYIYPLEGLIFILTAVALAKVAGTTGILTASLIANVLVTLFFLRKIAEKILGSLKRIAKPLTLSLGLISAASAISWFCARLSDNPYFTLAVTVGFGLSSLVFTWALMLPMNLRLEISTSIARILSKSGKVKITRHS